MASAGSGTAPSSHPLLSVAGFGSGGVTELASTLDPSTVTFCVARVPVGSGTFARDKIILMHVNSVHAELSFDDVKEVTLSRVLDDLSRIMSSDSGEYSAKKLREDYEAMIEKSKKGGASAAKDGVVLSRQTAAEMGSVKAEAALKAVKEAMGAWNWVLFTPEFEFVNAGSLSVPEMVQWVKEDQFYYGLLRLGFGTGRFRRTKWVFLTWTGSKVGTVKRARALGQRSSMKGRLGPASVDVEAAELDEITLPVVIDKVKRAAVVDGDDVHSAEDPYSVDNFMKALQEEAAANAAFFGDSGLQIGGSGAPKTAQELLRELRTSGHSTNWATFTVNA